MTGPAKESPKRRWFQLHASSYFMLLLVLGALVLANVPGDWRLPGEPYEFEIQRCLHGWPWTFLTRQCEYYYDLESAMSVWAVSRDVEVFSIVTLIGNLFVGLFFATMVVGAYELWRRQRNRIWQLHIRDLLALTLIVAVLANWIVVRADRYRDFLTLQAAHQRGYPRSPWSHEPWVPDWIRILYEQFDPPRSERFDNFTFLDDAVIIVIRRETPNLASLNHLRTQSRLRKLVIYTPALSDSDLHCLQDLSQLESVYLNCAQVTSKGLSHVNHLPSLRKLYLEGIDESALKGIAKLGELTHLGIYPPGLVDTTSSIAERGLSHLAGLTKLRDLNVSRSNVTDEGLIHLRTLKDLEVLSLDWTDVNGRGFEHLRSLTRLRYLSLRGCPIENKFLVHLSGLGLAGKVALRNTPITDEGLRHICQGNKLTELELCNTDITNAGLADVGQLATLMSLDLSGTQISDDGLVHLKSLQNLTHLRAVETNVTDEGIVHLGALRKLERLNLNGTEITDGGIPHLTKLRSRGVVLIVSRTKITRHGAARLVSANGAEISLDASVFDPFAGDPFGDSGDAKNK